MTSFTHFIEQVASLADGGLTTQSEVVSCSDPTLCEEKGLAHFEPFLAFADSTVQDLSCDKAIILRNTTQYLTIQKCTCHDIMSGMGNWTMMQLCMVLAFSVTITINKNIEDATDNS